MDKTMRTLLVAAFAALALAGTAQARQVHRYSYSRTFDTGGPNTQGIAVDQASQDVLVLNSTSKNPSETRVRKFTAAGVAAPFSGLGGATSFAPEPGVQLELTPGGPELERIHIAVDNSGGPSDGNFYVATPRKLFGYAPSGLPLPGFPVGLSPVSVVCALAVAPDGGIWMPLVFQHRYQEFTPAGVTGKTLRVGAETGCQVEFDSARNIYAVERGRIVKFAPDQTKLLDFLEGTPALAFDRGDDMAFALSGDQVTQLDSSGNPITSFGGPDPAHSYAGLSGATSLAANPQTHDLYVAHGNSADVFSPEPSAITVPTVSTEGQSDLAAASATLHGSVDPEGVQTTDCHFEWGTSAEYGNTAPCAEGDTLSGSGPIAVSAAIGGLAKGQTYHFRLVAKNANEEPSVGRDVRFAAADPPVVTAANARRITSDSVRIEGLVNPNGGASRFHVEIGTDTSYGTSVPAPDAGPANLSAPATILSAQGISQEVRDLSPDTTYHYRVVATNAAGTTLGADRTFTTFAAPASGEDACPNAQARQQTSASGLDDCRAYELVSAANSGGYDVRSELSSGAAALPTSPGAPGAALYSLVSGAIPGVAGNPTNRGADPYLARRGPSGWSTSYVGLPSDDPFASGPFASPLSGFDTALDSFAFGGEGICAPCFGNGSTNVPVRLPDGSLIEGMSGSLGSNANPAGTVEAPLSPDGSHLVFATEAQLEPTANSNGTDATVYERDLKAKTTEVISTDETGATIANGDGVAELAVSKDGSRVLIGELVASSEGRDYYHLYLHLAGRQQSIDLTPGATDGAFFAGMSEDGSVVYFTSKDALTTPSDQDSDSSVDLYRDEISGQSATLARVSTGAGGAGNTDSCAAAANSYTEHWNVAPGASPDCSVLAIGGGGGVAAQSGAVYFLSPEKLDGDGTEGAPNLFRAGPGESSPHFVATLESSDSAPLKPGAHPFKTTSGSFSNPTGLAIDHSNGDTYVLESTTGFNSSIHKLDSAGNPVGGFGSGGTVPGPFVFGPNSVPATIAVDNDPASSSYRDFYVPSFFTGSLFKYDPAGNLLGEVHASSGPTGVAVDPANGDIYVALQTGVEVLDPSGNSLSSFATNSALFSIAVDSHGIVYVTSGGGFNGEEPRAVEAFDSSGAFLRQIGGPTAFGIGVDPSDNHLFVDEGSKVSEYDEAGDPVGLPTEGHFSASRGLAADSGRLVVSDPPGENVAEFEPPLPLPDPAYDSPLAIDSLKAPGARHSEDFQVTPSGNDVAFPSSLPLSGFDAEDHYELFRYDSGEGIACVSCSPTGAAPSADAKLAATGLSLTDEGRVFFTTQAPLVLRDANERQDVYEWEHGEQQLISTGTSESDSALLSVSASGTDAFFFTRQKLVPEDENGSNVRLYDAREGGGFAFGPPSFQCAASDECHGAGTRAAPPLAASTTAGTPGQFSEEKKGSRCAKGKVSRKGRCVARHAKKRHARKRHSGKRHSHKRAAKADKGGGK